MNQLVLKLAVMLLWEVKESYTNDHQFHSETLDRVFGIYRIYYGKLPEIELYKLIRTRFPSGTKLDKMKWPDALSLPAAAS